MAHWQHDRRAAHLPRELEEGDYRATERDRANGNTKACLKS